jgi:hypothetical protein
MPHGRPIATLRVGRHWATSRCLGWPSAVSEDNVSVRGVFLDLGGTLVEPLKPDPLEDLTLILCGANAETAEIMDVRRVRRALTRPS